MPRKRKNYNQENDDDFAKGVLGIFVVVAIISYYKYSWTGVIISAISGIIILVFILYILRYFKEQKEQSKKDKINQNISLIKNAGLDNDVVNFISNFGFCTDKKDSCWNYRNYKISWDRINDLGKILLNKKVKLNNSEICHVLIDYIDKKELNLTQKSINTVNYSFVKLNGSEFEKLLYRLFETMGYAVQLNGGTGDQGGDLIANKGGERVLIQAKCYKDWSVSNKAVQEAVAARTHYNCNEAAVVTTSYFTKGAIDLAKTNDVKLINKKLLQEYLLKYLNESWI